MAKVDDQVFGKVKGKIGNLVYRQINGKTFVSLRPKKYNVTNTENSRKVKAGFKNLIKFSSYINSVPTLHKVWSQTSVKGNRTYNKIFSHNKKFIKVEQINENFLILPLLNGYNIYLNNINIAADKATIDISINKQEYNSDDFKKEVVLIFYEKDKDNFFMQSVEMRGIADADTMSLNIDLNYLYNNLLNPESGIIVYCGIVISDALGKIQDWSNSKGCTFPNIQ